MNKLFLGILLFSSSCILAAQLSIATLEPVADQETTLLALATTDPMDIVFDCGGVLTDVSRGAVFKMLGFPAIVRVLANRSSKAMRKEMYDHLSRLMPAPMNAPVLYDEQGEPLPWAICELMYGLRPIDEIRAELLSLISNDTILRKSRFERRLVKRFVKYFFTPELFVKTVYFKKEVVAFMRACIAAGHNVYVLSNYGKESFDLLRKKNPEIFEGIRGFYISGEKHEAKPHASCFQKFNNECAIAPRLRRAIFIDDQPENRVGMKLALSTEVERSNYICVHPNAIVRHVDNGRIIYAIDLNQDAQIVLTEIITPKSITA